MNKLLTICALALAPAGPALANDGPPSRVVSYADLDLNSAAGRATLDRRIAHAARLVCGDRLGLGSPLEAAQARRCSRLTLRDSRRNVALAVARAQRAAGEVQLAAR